MNNEFKKAIKKELNKTNVGELTPGSTPRRYEPAGGVKKLNERIHKESAQLDKYANLPFSFSKPPKPKKPALKRCSNCKTFVHVNINTVGVICSNCKQYSSVEDVPVEEEE